MGESMPEERWLPIAGWAGKYWISDHGRVWSNARKVGRIMKPGSHKDYPAVRLSIAKGNQPMFFVHRLVLEAFVGPGNGLDACHNDGSRTNNRLSNLRWDTHTNNGLDILRHGTSAGTHNAFKVRCKRGHLLQAPNLYAHTTKQGLMLNRQRRGCHSCISARHLVAVRTNRVPLVEVADRIYSDLFPDDLVNAQAFRDRQSVLAEPSAPSPVQS